MSSERTKQETPHQPFVYLFLGYWLGWLQLTGFLASHSRLEPSILPVAIRLLDLAGIVLTIWLGLRHYRLQPRDIFKISIRLKHDVLGGILLAALSLGLFAVDRYLFSRWFSEGTLQYYIRGIEAIRGFSGPRTVLQLLLMTCLLTPIIEELLFTGFLYSMAKVHYRRGIAVIAVGVMFSALHFNLPYVPALLLSRILYLLFFDWTGSLTGPIIAHCLHNLAVVLMISGS